MITNLGNITIYENLTSAEEQTLLGYTEGWAAVSGMWRWRMGFIAIALSIMVVTDLIHRKAKNERTKKLAADIYDASWWFALALAWLFFVYSFVSLGYQMQ